MRRIWTAAALQGAANLLGIIEAFGYAALTLQPTLSAEDAAFLLRWMFGVMVVVYTTVPFVLSAIGWPVARAFSFIDAGRVPPAELLERARARALNIPIYFGCTSTLVWLVCGASVLPFWSHAHAGSPIPEELWRGVQIIALSGAVSSTFVFYAVEAYMRRCVVPQLVRDGRVSDVKGAIFVPIWVRIALLLVTSAVAPIAVLVAHAVNGQATPTTILYVGGVFLTVGAVQAIFLCTTLARPLGELVSELRRVQAGDFGARAQVVSYDDVGAVGEGFNEMVEGLARAEAVRETFGRYVTRQVLDEILGGRVALGGELRDATVLFSDIRGFTELSERLPPAEVVRFLNEYLDIMVDVVVEHGGTVDKFIGDAILASFGVPLSAEDDAQRAVRAALSMLARLEQWNVERARRGEAPIAIGIGLHTGPVLAGNIGSAKKMEYTVIGDTVNTTSRIEQLNKQLGTRLLISDTTYAHVRDVVNARALPPAVVKGKRDALALYEVLGPAASAAA